MVVIIILIWLMFYYMNKASKRRHEAIIKEGSYSVRCIQMRQSSL